MSKQVCARKGGRYTSVQQAKRRDIVCKYYFEYGYSARKISQIMKVNRNTINRDINYLYTKMNEKNEGSHPETIISEYLEKMAYQKTRLRETLDDAKTISERATIEKLILSVDSKITDITLKTISSQLNMMQQTSEQANQLLKDSKDKKRTVSSWNYFMCSKNAQEKIAKIIQDDKKLR